MVKDENDLQISIGGVEILSFLLQGLDPHFPLLPAAGGGGSVALKELAPLLIWVVTCGSAPPAPCAWGVLGWGHRRGRGLHTKTGTIQHN